LGSVVTFSSLALYRRISPSCVVLLFLTDGPALAPHPVGELDLVLFHYSCFSPLIFNGLNFAYNLLFSRAVDCFFTWVTRCLMDI